MLRGVSTIYRTRDIKHTADAWSNLARCVIIDHTDRGCVVIFCAVCYHQSNRPRMRGHILRGVLSSIKQTADAWSNLARCVIIDHTDRGCVVIFCAVCYHRSNRPRMRGHILRGVLSSIKQTADAWSNLARCVIIDHTDRGCVVIFCAVCYHRSNRPRMRGHMLRGVSTIYLTRDISTPRMRGHILRGVLSLIKQTADAWSYVARCVENIPH
jgi:ribosomal protein L14E/L6E/L27E